MFDLLIIYSDGTSKTVECVTEYSIDIETGCFMYEKNGYVSFIPRAAVRFLGRESDYMNKTEGLEIKD